MARKRQATVTVVIPTYNSEKTLRSCLESIAAQTYPPCDIYVVDNYSTDSTSSIARAFGAKVLQSSGSMGKAKNIGAENASDFVFFVDSDQVLAPSVVQECVDLGEKGVDAVAIPEIPTSTGYWGKCIAYGRTIFEDNEFQNMPRFFARRVFEKIKYDESLLFYEEQALNIQLRSAGFQVARCASPLYHLELSNLRTMIRKYYRYGESLRPFYRSYGVTAVRVSTSTIRNLVHMRKLFRYARRNPLYFFGALVVKTLRHFAVALGYLESIL